MKSLAVPMSPVPTWTTVEEQDALRVLSAGVRKDGTIVEIGALYGGSTVILAKANPNAKITSIDEFSWTPDGYPEASREQFLTNIKSEGIKNVSVLDQDSRAAGLYWDEPIDFLFIDGGHSYKFVYSDLINFAKHAQVLALHDYGNPFWNTVREAVDDFLEFSPEWKVDYVAGTIAVLKRNS